MLYCYIMAISNESKTKILSFFSKEAIGDAEKISQHIDMPINTVRNYLSILRKEYVLESPKRGDYKLKHRENETNNHLNTQIEKTIHECPFDLDNQDNVLKLKEFYGKNQLIEKMKRIIKILE